MVEECTATVVVKRRAEQVQDKLGGNGTPKTSPQSATEWDLTVWKHLMHLVLRRAFSAERSQPNTRGVEYRSTYSEVKLGEHMKHFRARHHAPCRDRKATPWELLAWTHTHSTLFNFCRNPLPQTISEIFGSTTLGVKLRCTRLSAHCSSRVAIGENCNRILQMT